MLGVAAESFGESGVSGMATAAGQGDKTVSPLPEELFF